MNRTSSLKPILLALPVLMAFVCSCQQPKDASSTDEQQQTEGQQEKSITAADTLLETEQQIRSTSEQVERLGVPSPEEVDSLRERAYSLYKADSCSTAVPALQTHAEKANWLANVISKGLQPYYDASYDEQESMSVGRMTELAEYEKSSNELKRQRNRSYVLVAECERKIGNSNLAMVYYMSVLDLIDTDNQDLWDRARSGLYETVKVE